MNKLIDSVIGRTTDLGYATGWNVIRLLPEAAAKTLFRLGADVATRRGSRSINQLRSNLARVIGPNSSQDELDALVRQSVRSYARYWMEAFRLPGMDKAALAAAVDKDLTGGEWLDVGLKAGKGVVFALPHSGNWDVAALWLLEQGLPFATVVERLKPESLFQRFVEYREELGMEVLPLTGGPRPAFDILADRLHEGGVICLVADRDLSRHGIKVNFFGEVTRMPGGPARLAATTGAALIPVYLWFTDGGWGTWLGEPVDLGEGSLAERVQRGTQAVADAFASQIAAHPADWHMLQRLWLADLSSARRGDSTDTVATPAVLATPPADSE